MATGDIHNHNGTICKARQGRCPFGEDGHSKDIDSYVEHHVQESGVDGDAVRAMISDGTPPADAVEIAKEGLSATGSPLSKEDEAYEDEINEETFGEIRSLKGQERIDAIAEAEENLAQEYRDGLDETIAEGDSVAKLNAVYRNSLAAIHGVAKDRVATNSQGDIEVDRSDGGVSVYSKDFELKKSLDGLYETDESNRSIRAEIYGPIQKLSGAEREAAIKEAEAWVDSNYHRGRDETELEAEGTDLERDLRRLNRNSREDLAAIRGVDVSSITEYRD